MMLALAFILGFAGYLGAHSHVGAAYLLLGFVVCYLAFRFLAWGIKEFMTGLLLELGARASGVFRGPRESTRRFWERRGGKFRE